MAQIIPSYMETGTMGKKVLVYTVLKKSKTGKQLLKNFKSKVAAEKYAKK